MARTPKIEPDLLDDVRQVGAVCSLGAGNGRGYVMLKKMLYSAIVICITCLSTTASGNDPGWSKPADVVRGGEKCVTYKAAIHGNMLIVSAKHHGSWHTYAMDNDVRAKEKLAGKASLGVEAPTLIEVTGARARDGWRQSEPIDMSQPELRWYRWGFKGEAVFVTKLDPKTIADQVIVRIRGQVCDEKSCRQVDVRLIAPAVDDAPKFDFESLQNVKTRLKAQ